MYHKLRIILGSSLYCVILATAVIVIVAERDRGNNPLHSNHNDNDLYDFCRVFHYIPLHLTKAASPNKGQIWTLMDTLLFIIIVKFAWLILPVTAFHPKIWDKSNDWTWLLLFSLLSITFLHMMFILIIAFFHYIGLSGPLD